MGTSSPTLETLPTQKPYYDIPGQPIRIHSNSTRARVLEAVRAKPRPEILIPTPVDQLPPADGVNYYTDYTITTQTTLGNSINIAVDCAARLGKRETTLGRELAIHVLTVGMHNPSALGLENPTLVQITAAAMNVLAIQHEQNASSSFQLDETTKAIAEARVVIDNLQRNPNMLQAAVNQHIVDLQELTQQSLADEVQQQKQLADLRINVVLPAFPAAVTIVNPIDGPARAEVARISSEQENVLLHHEVEVLASMPVIERATVAEIKQMPVENPTVIIKAIEARATASAENGLLETQNVEQGNGKGVVILINDNPPLTMNVVIDPLNEDASKIQAFTEGIKGAIKAIEEARSTSITEKPELVLRDALGFMVFNMHSNKIPTMDFAFYLNINGQDYLGKMGFNVSIYEIDIENDKAKRIDSPLMRVNSKGNISYVLATQDIGDPAQLPKEIREKRLTTYIGTQIKDNPNYAARYIPPENEETKSLAEKTLYRITELLGVTSVSAAFGEALKLRVDPKYPERFDSHAVALLKGIKSVLIYEFKFGSKTFTTESFLKVVPMVGPLIKLIDGIDKKEDAFVIRIKQYDLHAAKAKLIKLHEYDERNNWLTVPPKLYKAIDLFLSFVEARQKELLNDELSITKPRKIVLEAIRTNKEPISLIDAQNGAFFAEKHNNNARIVLVGSPRNGHKFVQTYQEIVTGLETLSIDINSMTDAPRVWIERILTELDHKLFLSSQENALRTVDAAIMFRVGNKVWIARAGNSSDILFIDKNGIIDRKAAGKHNGLGGPGGEFTLSWGIIEMEIPSNVTHIVLAGSRVNLSPTLDANTRKQIIDKIAAGNLQDIKDTAVTAVAVIPIQ